MVELAETGKELSDIELAPDQMLAALAEIKSEIAQMRISQHAHGADPGIIQVALAVSALAAAIAVHVGGTTGYDWRMAVPLMSSCLGAVAASVLFLSYVGFRLRPDHSWLGLLSEDGQRDLERAGLRVLAAALVFLYLCVIALIMAV